MSKIGSVSSTSNEGLKEYTVCDTLYHSAEASSRGQIRQHKEMVG